MSNATNDPQAAYGKKREQILSEDTPVKDLLLSFRALNAIRMAEIETLGELIAYSDEELLRFRNIGLVTLSEVRPFRRIVAMQRDLSSYEQLIASGELIVKSELVEWLEEELRCSENASAHTMVISPDVPMVLQRVLDHINKKGSTTP